jgi:hypothetical protein
MSLACKRCGSRVPFFGVRKNCLATDCFYNSGDSHNVVALSHGPGIELAKLLKKIGIEPTPTCSCRAKASEMNAWGCDEASRPERIEEVVGVMREEAKARGLPFLDVAARLLVKRAIANARKAEAKRAKEAEAAAGEGPAA